MCFGECLPSIPGLPSHISSRDEDGRGSGDDGKHLQVARNFSHSGFKTAKDNHRLPTRLSFNLLDGQLYGRCEAVNGAVRFRVQ